MILLGVAACCLFTAGAGFLAGITYVVASTRRNRHAAASIRTTWTRP